LKHFAQPIVVGALCLFTAAAAHATKSCDELKTEIAAKLDAKGVKGYVLEVSGADDASTAQVVGRCEGGKKKVTYAKAKK
jgi:hypothetical protein